MSKGAKSFTFYILMILVFGSLMYFIAKEGETYQIDGALNSISEKPTDLLSGFTKNWCYTIQKVLWGFFFYRL